MHIVLHQNIRCHIFNAHTLLLPILTAYLGDVESLQSILTNKMTHEMNITACKWVRVRVNVNTFD